MFKKMKGLSKQLVIVGALGLSVIGGSFVSAAEFQDITHLSSESQQAIAWLADKGITTGYNKTTYAPQDRVTRAQMVTFLYRLADKPAVTINDFADTTGLSTEFRQAITWAKNEGITTGYNTAAFGPADSVTREQMAAFFNRLAEKPNPTKANPFLDVAADNEFKAAIAWLAETGITTGYTPTTYAPKDTVTREQMALFIKRYSEWSETGMVTPPSVPETPVETPPSIYVPKGEPLPITAAEQAVTAKPCAVPNPVPVNAQNYDGIGDTHYYFYNDIGELIGVIDDEAWNYGVGMTAEEYDNYADANGWAWDFRPKGRLYYANDSKNGVKGVFRFAPLEQYAADPTHQFIRVYPGWREVVGF
ncbi:MULTISPECIES: S-layer homology domain-containing protein [unclassified Enterococcus]|uniref:S-layer homology domain-containing protein n=1 Tax=unclassified Enterococcus TaxID=2608891 RepID=UPI001551D5D6|nr:MULTISPECIES: S-layer homology domain-containing protein [unclassified Enterococcus]MBS7577969.1 S-layer homology domain-containing protein [Enterococcus sp. MMGLQ5-2]MBS7585170.1 S-layer homology domain-containing protein [Enterococcus sp. MMGLQ5-1]NPD13027.1 S-layer homology domain-containing protein [Enterococcus sp. MMGLQ5-1]NPD37799.1 S-layer homology domain-containing protein [Enterococcus sp. MMGLQ5-2]